MYVKIIFILFLKAHCSQWHAILFTFIRVERKYSTRIFNGNNFVGLFIEGHVYERELVCDGNLDDT